MKTILGLAIIGFALYAAYLLLPHYIANYQLEDTIDSVARFGSVNFRATDEGMRENVLQEARVLDIPLQPEDVHVRRVYGEVLIWCDYSVHVDMPFHPMDLDFEAQSKSKERSGVSD